MELGKFFEKIKKVERIKEVSTEVWEVRWASRYGSYSSQTRPEMEIFDSKEDANTFADALKECFKLLRYKGDETKVEVVKR